MTIKKSFFLLFFNLKLLNLFAQTEEKVRLKPRFSITTNMGIVIPMNDLAEKNNIGFNGGTVVECDLSRHFFVRITWDYFQFRFVEKTKIGPKFIEINGKNNGNAFYLSSGNHFYFKKWNYYPFLGAGFTLLNDPKIRTILFNNNQFTYLSNQNARLFSLNTGFGVGYKITNKELLKLETNFFYLNKLNKNIYCSAQLGYHVFIGK
jgi:hypothetical protein